MVPYNTLLFKSSCFFMFLLEGEANFPQGMTRVMSTNIFNKSNRKFLNSFSEVLLSVAFFLHFSKGRQILLWGLPKHRVLISLAHDLRRIAICTELHTIHIQFYVTMYSALSKGTSVVILQTSVPFLPYS